MSKPFTFFLNLFLSFADKCAILRFNLEYCCPFADIETNAA